MQQYTEKSTSLTENKKYFCENEKSSLELVDLIALPSDPVSTSYSAKCSS